MCCGVLAGRGLRCREQCKNLTLDAQQLSGVELLEEVSVEAARLDGQVVQLALLVALVQDVLLNGALRHQAVDVHLPRLPDPVTSVLGLQQDTTLRSSLDMTVL